MNHIVRSIRIPALIIMMAGTLIAVSGCNRETEENPDTIREQISAYQSQINQLTLQINELERKLELMGERPRSRNRIPVSVIETELSTFEEYIHAMSTVEAIHTAIISPEINGQIKEVLVNKGQQVRAGQVVARLNTSVITSNMEEVKTSLDLARVVYQRQKGLWDQQIGSEMQYLEAKNRVETLETRLQTLESQMEMAVMRSPFDGVVDEIFLREGELAMPGSRVMHLLDLRRLYVNADVSESYLGVIKRGDFVTLRFPAYPEFEQDVPIHRVGHVINPENRTFRVQLLINNKEDRFKPNMLATMAIKVRTVDHAVVVPSILVRQDMQGQYVYTVGSDNGDTSAVKRYIERGPDSEGKTMVLSGLTPGEVLINRGHNQVTEGSLIRLEQQ